MLTGSFRDFQVDPGDNGLSPWENKYQSVPMGK